LKNKKIAILQSNYIPWKGYFDLINRVDEFILFDDMQYTRRDWRNRNKIKLAAGSKWLTLGVEVKGKYYQKINQTLVSDANWAAQHWQKIHNAYAKAPFFADYQAMVGAWYAEAASMTKLSDINHFLIGKICGFLDISTQISHSSDFQLLEGKSERLLQLCLDAGGDTYVSGPAAKGYLDVALFADNGVAVQWMDYDGYPPYDQLFGEFEAAVTILDVIFNCGPQSRLYTIREDIEC